MKKVKPIELKYEIIDGKSWSWDEGTEEWIKGMLIGYSLHLCCGNSKIGDVRMDILKRLKPDIVGDLFHLPFRPLSFDTVLVDPPFNYYFKVGWCYTVSDLARKRVIFSTPTTILRLKPSVWDKKVYAIDDGKMFMRIFQIFDRKVIPLQLENNGKLVQKDCGLKINKSVLEKIKS